MSRKSVVSVALALVFAVVGAGCGGGNDASSGSSSTAKSSASQTKTFTIGFTGDLTGALAVIDKPYLAGLDTALKSAKGNVKLKVNALDQGLDSARAQANFRQLASDNDLAIVMNGISDNALQALPLAGQSQVALLFYAPTDDMVGKPWLIGTGPLGSTAAKLQVDSLLAETKANPKLAVLTYDSAGVREARGVAEDYAKGKGATIATTQTVDVSAADVTAQAAAVAKSNPDGVILMLLDNQAPAAVRAIRSRGFDGPIINWNATSASTLKAAKDPKFSAQFQNADPAFTSVEGVPSMIAAAKSTGHQKDADSLYFGLGYVHGLVLSKLAQKCGVDCSRKAFFDLLAAANISEDELGGLAGSIESDPKSPLWMKTLAVYAWENGDYKQVSPYTGVGQ